MRRWLSRSALAQVAMRVKSDRAAAALTLPSYLKDRQAHGFLWYGSVSTL